MRKIQYIPPEPSSLAIVGEAPGADETTHGIPFIGKEGQYYQRRILGPAGIKYNAKTYGKRIWNSKLNRKVFVQKAKASGSVYVTNTVHKKPPKNIYDALPLKDRQEGLDQLKKDLTSWKEQGLKVVLAVGAKSLEALTGYTKISALRGTVLPCTLVPDLKVVATLHPGNLFRGNHVMEPIVKIDHEYAIEETKYKGIRYPERNVHIFKDYSEAIALLEQYTDVKDLVAVDIETNSRELLVAFGWAISPSRAYVIPKEFLKIPSVLRAVSRFCASSTPKLYHNVLFDVFFLAYYYAIINRNFLCSLIAFHSVYPTLPKSLGFIASIYTHEPYWKDEGKDAIANVKKGLEIDWENFYLYNGKDCCLTYESWSFIKSDMKDWNAEGIFNFMMDLTDPCLYAMLKGIAYDREADQGYAKKNEKAIKMMETIIDKGVCQGLNVKSPKQLKELIYDEWDMPKQYKQGRLTTEEKKLHKLETFGTPYKLKIGAIRVCKKLYKDREFYNLNLDKDERIRTGIRPFGTYTGRFSTRKSITGSGRNFQNIPKQLRKAYVPDPGKVFLPCDLSQAEARVVAALCRDQEWLTSFDTEDQHTKVASMIYNIPVEQVEKATHRQIAKRVSHASHYLLGPGLLSEIIGCTMNEAKDLKARYFAFRNSLLGWHEEVRQIVYKKKYIRTVFGRVMQFFGPATDEVIREAVAAEPQSTSADYLNHGIKDFNENLPKEYEFLIQVHDSILPQVPDDLDFIKWIIPEMERLMHKDITIKGLTFSIPLDMSIAFSFGDEVEIKGSIDDAYYEAKEKHEKSKKENKLLLDKLS